MKRVITIVLVLAVVAGASWLIYSRTAQPTATTAAPADVLTDKVTRGSIDAVVGATGNVEVERLQALTFDTSGTVSQVLVQEGDTVEADQVLARLDTSDLELSVKQAQAALDTSQASLARTRVGPTEEEVAAAQAAVAAAQAALADSRQGASDIDQQLAQLQIDQAKNSLYAAQANRDAVAGNKLSSPGALDSAKAQVLNAEVAVQIAELQYQKLLEPPKSSAMLSAASQLASAQSSLARLLASPSPEDIAVAEAQVKQSQIALEIAQSNLKNAELRAPFAGVIASLDMHVGDLVGPSVAVANLADLSRYHITLSIDETDIGRVAEGQKATIVLDTFSDQQLTGTVAHISLVGTNSQGIIVYSVRVDLDPTDLALKPLMTASVNLIVGHRDDVLLVPNQALRRDASGTYVEVTRAGIAVRVPVTIGLTDDIHTEVQGELHEGDAIVVSQPRGSIFSGAMLGGG